MNSTATQTRALRRAVWWTLAALAGFVAVDAALFRTGWYSRYLSPDSTTAQVEYRLLWLKRSIPPKTPSVAVVGDSRIAEGFSAIDAEAAAGGQLHFVNFGMPGATPRVWYYTLRDADPQRNLFSSIAIMLEQYSDQDGSVQAQDRVSDMNFLAGRLRLSDCLDYAGSWLDADLRQSALAGCLFPGTRLRADARDFLSNIRRRLSRARDWRNNGARYIADYKGRAIALEGLSADWSARTIHFPPGLSESQKMSIRATVMPDGDDPQTGALTRYRERWLGGIVDLYRNSATRIVFFEIPRAPLPVPDARAPARFVQAVSARARVSVLPEKIFRDLEDPATFADGLHLNEKGRPIFSARLGRIMQDRQAVSDQ